MARPLELADLHPLIVAMLEFLPDLPDNTPAGAGVWPVDEYELWMRALDANLRLLYGLPDDPADAHLIAGWARRPPDAPVAPPSSPPAADAPAAAPPAPRPARATLRPPDDDVVAVPIPAGWPLDIEAAGGRRKFTVEQKREAVALANIYGPIATSRALNLSESVLRAWRLNAADVAARADELGRIAAQLAKPIDPAPPDPGTSSPPPATVDEAPAADTLRLVDNPADPPAEPPELDEPDGVLRCDLASDREPAEPCGYVADSAADLDRHLKRRHQLYAGDDPDDVEFRRDRVRDLLAAAGLSTVEADAV